MSHTFFQQFININNRKYKYLIEDIMEEQLFIDYMPD